MARTSSATKQMNWAEANQHALSAALAVVRARLAAHSAEDQTVAAQQIEAATQAYQVAEQAMPAPSAIETLRRLFNLSLFERDVILLCAGMELEASFVAVCVAAHGDPQKPYPTFSLALATLPEAHWSALTPSGALRQWRLIEFVSQGGLASAPLTTRPLRLDERVLHYLTGVEQVDERLAHLLEAVPPASSLMPSHQSIAARAAETWSRSVGNTRLPVINLYGADAHSALAIAAHACAAVGLQVKSLPLHALPTNPNDLLSFIRLWEREAALSASALLVDCDDNEATDAAREYAVNDLIEKLRGALLIVSRERRHAKRRVVIGLEIQRPKLSEQRQVWEAALGARAAALDGQLDMLMSQFSLSVPAIHSAAVEVNAQPDEAFSFHSLWEACRNQTRTRLDELAQKIEPTATWDDLVLPEAQKEILRDITAHVRHRAKVYETWGFAKKGTRGLGISALFAGASGTGKTMAAEVLANELRLDLYRIDLSSVVSKYIGETEKNLRRVFDAAEASGAILLFDEADALFGKRSDVKDSHDRYANIEVSYLLQRMECYRGLAILTTNLKSALDQAFLRRIRFIVQFPFPDMEQRAEIWQRVFPVDAPLGEIHLGKLAQLNVPGGNIRNIALSAAFLAADENVQIGMTHLLFAARTEYSKLEKTLTDAELLGWS